MKLELYPIIKDGGQLCLALASLKKVTLKSTLFHCFFFHLRFPWYGWRQWHHHFRFWLRRATWLFFIDFSIEFRHSLLGIISLLKFKGRCQFFSCRWLVRGREGWARGEEYPRWATYCMRLSKYVGIPLTLSRCYHESEALSLFVQMWKLRLTGVVSLV